MEMLSAQMCFLLFICVTAHLQCPIVLLPVVRNKKEIKTKGKNKTLRSYLAQLIQPQHICWQASQQQASHIQCLILT